MSKMLVLLGALLHPIVSLFGGNTVPETVRVEGNVYRTGFYDTALFSTYRTAQEDEISRSGDVGYYKVCKGNFTLMTYANRISSRYDPLYCLESQFEQAKKYYYDAASYTYHCRIGDVGKNPSCFRFDAADGEMFDRLSSFCEEHSYDPFSAKKNRSVVRISLPLPGDGEPEIVFYKISKDGLFTSSKAHHLHIMNGVMYLAFQYCYDDGGDDEKLEAVELPDDLRLYFTSLIRDGMGIPEQNPDPDASTAQADTSLEDRSL